MRVTLSALLISSMFVASCGGSSLNPLSWFGRSTSVPIAQETVNPLIPQSGGLFKRRTKAERNAYVGTPFEQITNLKVERVPGGAIIRATGLAARQGIYAVRLTPANEDETPVDGVLTYRLEGVRPSKSTPAGATATREVTAARKLTDQELLGVRTIRIEGTQNALVARR